MERNMRLALANLTLEELRSVYQASAYGDLATIDPACAAWIQGLCDAEAGRRGGVEHEYPSLDWAGLNGEEAARAVLYTASFLGACLNAGRIADFVYAVHGIAAMAAVAALKTRQIAYAN